jgi:hypothetical protein
LPAKKQALVTARRSTMRDRIPIAVILCGLILLGLLSAYLTHRSLGRAQSIHAFNKPQSVGQARLDYDQIKDVSTVSVGAIDDPDWRMLIGNGDGTYKQPTGSKFGTFVEFEASLHGTAMSEPPPIVCHVVESLGEFDDEMPDDNLYFLVDGHRFSAPVVDSRRGYAAARLSPDQTSTIAQAKSVEIEAGNLQYMLTDYQISGLRDLAKTLGLVP